jgi:hypothetical protein
MFALQRPPHLSSTALDDVQSPRIRQLYEYWRSKCNDVIPPPRSAIEPAEIRPLLPFLMLAELSAQPFGIFYRLVGTAVARAHDEDFTGRAHGDVASFIESGIEESYRQAAATRAPVFGRTGLQLGDHSWLTCDYAIFPLSDDGIIVNKCLAIECSGLAEASSAGGDLPGAASFGHPPAPPAEQAEAGETGHHER